MELLFIGTYNFKEKDGTIYTIPAYSDGFWDQFLDSFSKLRVLGEPFRVEDSSRLLVPINRKDINVVLVPPLARPLEGIKNYFKVKKTLKYEIINSRGIIIKIASRKAIMAIKLAKKYYKPYMVGCTGDLYSYLKNSGSIIKRWYASIIHFQMKKALQGCKYATYVTQEYLQSVYPINGKMCGFSDVVLPYISRSALEKRIDKINRISAESKIKLGLVGSYHSNMKGIDTAIFALREIGSPRVYLHILGMGSKEDQERWLRFGKDCGVDNIVFDTPISDKNGVFEWYDDVDICILPSRSEGLPRCIIEAISRACPCIVSSAGGMSELVESKWVHSPEDFVSLANKLREMINNPQTMESTAKENFNHSYDYCLESVRKTRNTFFNDFKTYVENSEKQRCIH